MGHSTGKFNFSIARFAPDLEPSFQADYYAFNLGILRVVALFMASVSGVALFLCQYNPTLLDQPFHLPQIGFWLIVFALTISKLFARHWQLFTVVLGGAMAIFVLSDLAYLLGVELDANLDFYNPVPTGPQKKFYFVMRFAILMVSLSALRLQFRPAALMFASIVIGGVWAFLRYLPHAPSLALDARFSLLPASVLFFSILLLSFVGEGLSRRAWWANHQLEIERNDERRAREQTEGKLQILGQAIGAIVHDLGNPLTSVQMGASTLDFFLDHDDKVDKKTIKEFTAIINNGSQMLNFLRLSLIEQTRVLEGQPIPVELKPTSIRQIVGTGAKFQKPGALAGREVVIECPDAQICADEMKMVTVWMNLIGNALKYSDGQVRIEWCSARDENGEPLLRMAALDAGTKGVGITQEQATQLFKAFGRLKTHAQIEGTGLGLMSVQKIVEAHGGEVFIEGFKDGTPGSGSFSTAQGQHRAMLHGDFRTAFVATCPVATA